jgi:hypothetical protein
MKPAWKAALGFTIAWILLTTSLQVWIMYGLTELERSAVNEGTLEKRLMAAQDRVRDAEAQLQSLVDSNPPTTTGRVVLPDVSPLLTDLSWLGPVPFTGKTALDTNRASQLIRQNVFKEGVTRETASDAQFNLLQAASGESMARGAIPASREFVFRMWLVWAILTGVPVACAWLLADWFQVTIKRAAGLTDRAA